MSSDEQIPAVADIENAKKSDGPSSASEHTVDKVNGDDEEVPQSDSKAKVPVDDKKSEDTATAASNHEVKNGDHDDGKMNNGKRDIDQVDQHDEKTNGDKGNNDNNNDEEEDEAVVSTTSNKKVKIIHLSTDETAGENDDASASAKVPNEELTVV